MELTISEALQKKWQPILEHADLPQIKDPYRRAVTTMLLENQEQYLHHLHLTSTPFSLFQPFWLGKHRTTRNTLRAYL